MLPHRLSTIAKSFAVEVLLTVPGQVGEKVCGWTSGHNAKGVGGMWGQHNTILFEIITFLI